MKELALTTRAASQLDCEWGLVRKARSVAVPAPAALQEGQHKTSEEAPQLRAPSGVMLCLLQAL